MPAQPAEPSPQPCTSAPGGDANDANEHFAIQRVAAELASRWARACADAVVAMGGEAMLASADAKQLEAALRCAFDNGLALGRSFCRHHGIVLEQHDLGWLLPRLGECAGGRELVHRDGANWLQREPCAQAGTARCAFYREALDGLVLGLSDGEIFFRRHRAGAADTTCLDVSFPATAGSHAEKYGPIPADMIDALGQVAASLARLPGITVRFIGLSEGVLSFVIDAANSELATDAAVERAVKRRFAALTTRNLAPRGVLGAGS